MFQLPFSWTPSLVDFTNSHGGGGTFPGDSRYFDPAAYRIILFDQRGSGQSTPAGELRVGHRTYYVLQN